MGYPLKQIFITSPYGMRQDPFNPSKTVWHNGVDYRLHEGVGTPLYAIADGIVKVSKTNGGGVHVGYGHYILIEHDGYCSLYAHLQKLGIPVGTRVKEGDLIGYGGNSGESKAPHLHFEIRNTRYVGDMFVPLNGRQRYTVDPVEFLEALNRKLPKPDWKESIIIEAYKNGLINDLDKWITEKDNPAPVWMILGIANGLNRKIVDESDYKR